VEDDLDTVDRARTRPLVAQIALDELDASVEMREVGATSGGEVIDDANRLAHLREARGNVGTNEPCPAGDEPGAEWTGHRDVLARVRASRGAKRNA
jgi:hypothetical protein